MKTHRMLVIATLAGVVVCTAVPRAHALDPYSQELLANMLYGLVLGSPYGAPGNLPYEPPRSDPYRTPTSYDPYGPPPYGRYDPPPYYDPYGPDRRGYDGLARVPSCPVPYDYDRGRYDRDRYQERMRQLDYKYNKAMNRLDRQEAEARAKGYRKSYGDPARYRERMEKIDRKYAHKRYKVERNTARDYRKISDRD